MGAHSKAFGNGILVTSLKTFDIFSFQVFLQTLSYAVLGLLRISTYSVPDLLQEWSRPYMFYSTEQSSGVVIPFLNESTLFHVLLHRNGVEQSSGVGVGPFTWHKTGAMKVYQSSKIVGNVELSTSKWDGVLIFGG